MSADAEEVEEVEEVEEEKEVEETEEVEKEKEMEEKEEEVGRGHDVVNGTEETAEEVTPAASLNGSQAEEEAPKVSLTRLRVLYEYEYT